MWYNGKALGGNIKMLTLTKLENSSISIKADYYYGWRIKKIPDAYFNFATKEWIIPIDMLDKLESEFNGELVYKTPKWVLHNQPMPDMEKMYRIKRTDIAVPEMKLKPYDYQSYGIRFMIDRIMEKGFVLNADDVGLGKTIMTIGTMKWFIENHGFKHILIICKKSIKGQWIDEINKFTEIGNEFQLIKTKNTANQRKKAYDEFNATQKAILVTNYHSFLNDTELFLKMKIDFVVIDEVHSVKAREGVLNNHIGQVTTGRPTVFLTGTPIMSKPEDIFGIVQMVNKQYFGKWNDFSKRYLTIDFNNRFGPKVVGAKNLDELREKVQDIVIRRTEYEVSIQLPETIIKKVMCEMDSTQKKLLEEIRGVQDDISLEVDELKGLKNKTEDDEEKIVKLESRSKGLIAARQAASTDPRMFLLSRSKMMRENFGKLIPSSYKMSSKTESIIDLVEDILGNDDKVILFSKFRTCADMIAKDIRLALNQEVLLYTGAEDDEERENAIRNFRDTTHYNVLIGTEAMAEGLNLQCAKYIINIDQPDTFAIKTQRIGRVRRSGSTFNNVVVYDMITESIGNVKSKDEERLENIQKNQNVTDALVSINEAQRKSLIEAMKKEN